MHVSTVLNKSNAITAAAATAAAYLANTLTKGSSGWVQGLATFGAILVAVPVASHFAK